MSAIALAWVAKIKVGNQTAKQLLQFYASHNFNKPGFEFKNERLAEQLEVSVRAIQKAHELLLEKNLIIKEPRYNENGRQISNVIYLNIPQESVDNFFGEGERSSSLGVNVVQGEDERSSHLINNNPDNLNLNLKKPDNRQNNFPDERHKQMCQEKRLNLEEEIRKFYEYHQKKKTKPIRMGALFTDWLKHASDHMTH